MTSADRWRNRKMEVRVLDRCDECETLQPDVKERSSYWPTFKLKSCQSCFTQRVEEFNTLSST